MAETMSKSAMVEKADRNRGLELFANALSRIPEAVDDDGSGMIVDVMNMTSRDQMIGEPEFPSAKALASLKDAATHQYRILGEGIVRRKSTITDEQTGEVREGEYLIVPAIDKQTGQLIRFNTGAGLTTAKIAKMYAEGWLPADVTFTLADKTKNGYRPVNLNVLAFH